MRRLLFILGTVVLLLVGAVAAGIAALQTDSGRAWLAASISSAVSSADSRVAISGLSGSVPSQMQVAKIEVADRDGVWLDVTDAALELRLGDLLRRQLTIHRLSAESVAVLRAPQGPAARQPEKPSAKSEPFALPRLPVRIAVDGVAIKRLSLSEDVLGQAVAVGLTAQGRLGGDAAAAQLAIERIDGTPGHARLDFSFDQQQSLALHLDVVEPSGALLKGLPDQPGPLPLTIAIHGDGPLDGWNGAIRATAGSSAQIDATVTLAAGERPRLVGKGTLAVQSLLPAKFRTLVQQPITFDTAVAMPGETIVLERLALDAGALTLAASGQFDRTDQRLSVQADLGVPDLQALDAVIGAGLHGSATAALKADGTVDAPQLALDLAAKNLSGPVGVERLGAKLHATRRDAVWSLQGSGDVAGLALPQPGLPDALDWTLDANFDETASRAILQALTLRARGVEIAATGRAEALDQSPRGQARIDLKASDLAAWQELTGQPLAGRLSLGTDITFDADAMTAKLAGKGEELVTGQPYLDALLGGRLGLRGTLRRGADGALAADDIDLSGANVAALANAKANADFSDLDAHLKLDAPRLDVLTKALGTPTRGAVSIQSHFTGSLDRLAAQIDAAGQDLRFGTQRAERLTAKASLTDALAPSGTLTVAVRSGKLDANLDAAFARRSADVVEVSRFALRAPGSEMNGAVKLNTAQLGANGALSLKVTDLSPWSALAGTPLAGTADARVTLVDKDGQRADVDGSLGNLRFGDAPSSVERVKIEARLTDLLRKPGGRAAVEASRIVLPDLRIDRLRANAQAVKPDTYTVSLDTRGVLRPDTAAQPLRLATTAEIAIAGSEQRVRVTQLNGRVGPHNIVSHAPLTLSSATNRFKLDGLDLGIGEGRVTAAAARDGNRLSLQTQIRSLPLALVRLAMPTQKVSGALDGTVRFAGTPAQPDGQVNLSLREVRTGSMPNLPPLSLTSQGTWKGQRFDVTGELAVADKTKLDIRAAVPLKLDAATLMPGLIENGPLHANVKGDGRLEHWAALLPTGEDRVGGHYAIDLSVGGTPAAPEPQGEVAIDDGSYVSFAAGTQIKDLSVKVTGNGRRFELTRLIANDGGKGTIDGSGAVDLGAETMIDANLRFVNFTFARRDDVTASGDGTIRFAGTPQASKLSGQLRLERAEIRIPERLPPSIPNLPVVVVDSNSGEAVSEPEKAAHASTVALALDIAIPGRAFVRGRGLDSEWRGNMHVGGTTGTPQLRGKLETVRGDVSLLGKRFTLTDSNITFIGGEKVDPQLAITAEHRAAAIVAQVEITGTVSSPGFKLTSQPEMPQDEVLSRVLFGRSVGEMTPAQGLELAQAAASLAGGGGPGILDRFRTAVGLDRLDIGSSQQASGGNGANSSSGPSVTAGKYVTDRVFLGVEQGREPNSTRSKVEVEITPNITAETSLGGSSAGAGVNWKWDY